MKDYAGQRSCELKDPQWSKPLALLPEGRFSWNSLSLWLAGLALASWVVALMLLIVHYI